MTTPTDRHMSKAWDRGTDEHDRIRAVRLRLYSQIDNLEHSLDDAEMFIASRMPGAYSEYAKQARPRFIRRIVAENLDDSARRRGHASFKAAYEANAEPRETEGK